MSFLGRQKYAAGQPADIPGPIVQTGLFRGVIQVSLNYISILSAGVCQADNKTFRAKGKMDLSVDSPAETWENEGIKKQLSDRSRQAICLRETHG